jgi:predicted SAM-dependent methyltransferase
MTTPAPSRPSAVRDDGRMLDVARTLRVSRAALWMVRTELEALSVSIVNVVWPPARGVIRGLRRQRDLLVNVASGPFTLDGFVNLELRRYHPEIVRWDCRTSLPLSDASCRGIRIEHFVEHLDPRDELPSLLAHCFRALMPGGVLRVIVPDAARYLRAYVDGGRRGFDDLATPNPFPSDLPTALDVVNHVFHQWHEHRWAYDLDNLSWRLRDAGFTDIQAAAFRKSRLPALAVDREEHAPYSLYVEGVRPAA